VRNIHIEGNRLWDTLMEMAKIGATPKGGCRRLALTDLDKESRDLFVSWCKNAGCTVKVDSIGNLFARRPGKNNTLAPITVGSHLDTQPSGGKFDGVLGVMAGLEVIRTLNDHKIETEAPVEVCVWTNEEGTRFAPSMMGSGVFAGAFDINEIKALEDTDGAVLGEELERIGYAGNEPAGEHKIGSYFELHIEQGPILEAEEKTIGIVGAANGQGWYDITVTGQDSHAGPTPMPRRKDALVSASKIIQEINNIGHKHPPFGAATVGFMQVNPNSRNVIPGEVVFSVDMRHPEADALVIMEQQMRSFCENLSQETDMEIEISKIWDLEPTVFDEGCVNAVREGATLCDYEQMEIVSGAGHDAIYVAQVAPTAMIFVPCEDGISHNEIENASPEHCAAGCDVLLHAVLNRAGTAS
jgi:beta-ureidopropionase / N-carbamoyl-L-amino-acid hydrolase